MAFVTNSLNFPNLSVKITPTTSDVLLISDAADSSALKQITVGTLPFAPLSGAAIVNVTAATQQLAKDTVYFVNYTSGVCVLTIPAAVDSVQGDFILIIGGESASNPFQIAVNASQQLRCLDQLTTATTGTLTATTNFDWALLRCDALSGGLTWTVMTNGNFNGT